MGNFSPKLLKRNLWESLQSPQKLFLVGRTQNEAFHTKARGSNFYLSEAKWSNFHFECEASKLKAQGFFRFQFIFGDSSPEALFNQIYRSPGTYRNALIEYLHTRCMQSFYKMQSFYNFFLIATFFIAIFHLKSIA